VVKGIFCGFCKLFEKKIFSFVKGMISVTGALYLIGLPSGGIRFIIALLVVVQQAETSQKFRFSKFH